MIYAINKIYDFLETIFALDHALFDPLSAPVQASLKFDAFLLGGGTLFASNS